MSNPLLRPDDPRFQQRDIREADGTNPFADEAQEADAENAATSPQAGEAYAATAAADARPFVPQYAVQQESRAGLLLTLGGFGWAGALVGGLSLAGLFDMGWISPLVGATPAGAAWLLAHEELKAIRFGAIRPEARQQAWHAYWLGLSGLAACIIVVAAMIYRQMSFMPNL
jgi:hypothetical protein